jgi:hypothetical protein
MATISLLVEMVLIVTPGIAASATMPCAGSVTTSATGALQTVGRV